MTKLMIASDLHGSYKAAKELKAIFEKSGADKLILLGDLLYHGPRNDFPVEYSPKEVTALLNEMKEDLLCVHGNCDADVDQMVLNFPITVQNMLLYLDGKRVFVAHGDIFNTENPPALSKGDILLHGHTHLPVIEDTGEFYYLNPGSAALPKGGNPPSYMIYEDGVYTIYDLDGNMINKLDVNKAE